MDLTCQTTPITYFNSQPHEEADYRMEWSDYVKSISTHSLTKRLTGKFSKNHRAFYHFNSQPHEEADGEWMDVGIGREIFQLTASRRG